MSAHKSERLVNLLIMLLAARGWISRDRIRVTVEGYRGLDATNFERTFERDKAELRAAGVPLEVDDEGEGYRIDRSSYELPPISFSPEELAALGAAARVWQDSVAADGTRQALATLRAAGAEPDPSRLEVLAPRLGAVSHLMVWREGVTTRREVRFGYAGATRRVQPWTLFSRGGRWYVTGLDPDRQAERRFRLDKVSGTPRLVGAAGAFEPPEEVTTDFVRDDTVARVAVREGRGRDLLRGAPPAKDQSGAPPGFVVHEVRPGLGLVGEICALGADAVALEPSDLVAEVVAQLRAVAGVR
ncbi:WYL domain-containing protein [Arachnia propionica]|uniref:WYL domain-containing protein n=1 Tax=Arachnia propionica TaxID=1750 RepID=A0A3P1T5V0_9ACTN|nr:WYL domain-containing protein [Arachnia propionica]MDO5083431.1 WYL domain-containing protein [Arachnia propionica]RRD04872.1 WYL domain-containing protein [Arachnia propionica]